MTGVQTCALPIYGGQVQPVIKRQQNVGDDEIAYEEAETGLHIGHVDAAYHTRNGNEGNPEREAPIIPKETIYQGERRLPRKNASLSE